MYFGGYQPIQKWLKDRKGMYLQKEDIVHLLSTITILDKTQKIMSEIDAFFDLI